MVEVVEVDPYDDQQLREFWEVEQAAIRADRPHPVIRTLEFLRSSSQQPGEYFGRQLLAAVDGGRIVGVAELGLWFHGNDHLAGIEVNVLPDHRRRGIGRLLHDEVDRRRRAAGRTSVVGEVSAPVGTALADTPATAFALALGFESVHVEHHLVLRLPVEEDHLDRLRDEVAGRSASYDVITWQDRCPDEYVEAFCAMHTQMSSDVPSGDLDIEVVVWDEARLRSSEERMARSFGTVTAVVRRRADGAFGGYSELYLPHGEAYAQQDDTLVMPEHRGHRLGTVLKLATLGIVRADHPERESIHTWTNPDNHAMYRTNAGLGFELVEVMHEMQRKDPA